MPAIDSSLLFERERLARVPTQFCDIRNSNEAAHMRFLGKGCTIKKTHAVIDLDQFIIVHRDRVDPSHLKQIFLVL